MYIVTTYLGVRPGLLGKAQKRYVDAKGDETGDFQLLEVNDLAFVRRCFTLPWSGGFLEGVGSGGFCALVT